MISLFVMEFILYRLYSFCYWYPANEGNGRPGISKSGDEENVILVPSPSLNIVHKMNLKKKKKKIWVLACKGDGLSDCRMHPAGMITCPKMTCLKF